MSFLSRRPILLLSLLIVGSALLLPAYGVDWSCLSGGVRGSGRITDTTRAVGAFHRIRLEGPIDVRASQGEHASVTVHADDNLAPLIVTEVVDDTLVVRTAPRRCLESKAALQVQVVLPRLDAAELSGSGDLMLDGLHADTLDLKLRGSGNIEGHGQVTQLKAQLSGSGDLKLTGLSAETAKVSLTGSGDAQVQVHQALDVHLSGSGDIRYGGHPSSVVGKVSGSGELHEAQ